MDVRLRKYLMGSVANRIRITALSPAIVARSPRAINALIGEKVTTIMGRVYSLKLPVKDFLSDGEISESIFYRHFLLYKEDRVTLISKDKVTLKIRDDSSIWIFIQNVALSTIYVEEGLFDLMVSCSSQNLPDLRMYDNASSNYHSLWVDGVRRQKLRATDRLSESSFMFRMEDNVRYRTVTDMVDSRSGSLKGKSVILARVPLTESRHGLGRLWDNDYFLGDGTHKTRIDQEKIEIISPEHLVIASEEYLNLVNGLKSLTPDMKDVTLTVEKLAEPVLATTSPEVEYLIGETPAEVVAMAGGELDLFYKEYPFNGYPEMLSPVVLNRILGYGPITVPFIENPTRETFEYRAGVLEATSGHIMTDPSEYAPITPNGTYQLDMLDDRILTVDPTVSLVTYHTLNLSGNELIGHVIQQDKYLVYNNPIVIMNNAVLQEGVEWFRRGLDIVLNTNKYLRDETQELIVIIRPQVALTGQLEFATAEYLRNSIQDYSGHFIVGNGLRVPAADALSLPDSTLLSVELPIISYSSDTGAEEGPIISTKLTEDFNGLSARVSTVIFSPFLIALYDKMIADQPYMLEALTSESAVNEYISDLKSLRLSDPFFTLPYSLRTQVSFVYLTRDEHPRGEYLPALETVLFFLTGAYYNTDVSGQVVCV